MTNPRTPPDPRRQATPPSSAPRPGGAQRPAPKKAAPIGRRSPPPVSPADRARQDALFAEAGMSDTEAAAAGKDPEAAASILARKHTPAIVRLIGGALKRGQEGDLAAARRVAGHLYD